MSFQTEPQMRQKQGPPGCGGDRRRPAVGYVQRNHRWEDSASTSSCFKLGCKRQNLWKYKKLCLLNAYMYRRDQRPVYSPHSNPMPWPVNGCTLNVHPGKLLPDVTCGFNLMSRMKILYWRVPDFRFANHLGNFRMDDSPPYRECSSCLVGSLLSDMVLQGFRR